MNLYIIRHCEAASVGGAVRHDADRPLTARGEEDALLVAEVLAALDSSIGRILSSPLVRALQTSRIIASRLPGAPPVTPSGNLSPGFRPKALLTDLAAAPAGKGIIIVGHQPDLGELIGHLIADGSPVGWAFPPGAMARLSYDPARSAREATMHWFLTPDTLRRLKTQN
jgi:phosphohistidine phosphatase